MTRTLPDGSTITYSPEGRIGHRPEGDLLSRTPPVVRVHLSAATLDAAAAVCHVRGLPHLVLLLDRAAAEIRQQEGETND